jgi:hypothetical protein
MKLGEKRELSLRRERGLRLVHHENSAWLQPVLEKRHEGLPVRALVKRFSTVRVVRVTQKVWIAFALLQRSQRNKELL